MTSRHEIPAALVKELRDLTGAGMMDCKRALVETDGDLEAARQLLREQGLAEAGKRAGRETSEGRVVSRVDGVARRDRRRRLRDRARLRERGVPRLRTARPRRRLGRGARGGRPLEEERVELVAKLGENIVVVGAERYEAADGEVVADYIHPPAQQDRRARAREGDARARPHGRHAHRRGPAALPQPRRGARRPRSPTSASVYEKLPEVESKPEDVRPKIVEGMLAKRFFARPCCSTRPGCTTRASRSGKALAEHGAEVKAFVRYNVGRE